MTAEECLQKGAVYWRGDQLVCSPYDDEDMIMFYTQHDVSTPCKESRYVCACKIFDGSHIVDIKLGSLGDGGSHLLRPDRYHSIHEQQVTKFTSQLAVCRLTL